MNLELVLKLCLQEGLKLLLLRPYRLLAHLPCLSRFVLGALPASKSWLLLKLRGLDLLLLLLLRHVQALALTVLKEVLDVPLQRAVEAAVVEVSVRTRHLYLTDVFQNRLRLLPGAATILLLFQTWNRL